MFKKIINSLKEGTFFEKVINRLSIIKYIFYTKKFNNLNIDDKKVIFMTFQGKYACNPKAICEEFLNRKLDYKLIWVVNKITDKTKKNFPKEVYLVERGSKEFFKELSTSKFIIENANDITYLYYTKKQGQYIFQTWHGSLGFKRIDASSVKNRNWVKKAKKASLETDYIISNSEFENMVYRTSYWKDTNILEYGHARNDILFNKKECNKINDKVRKYYNIDKKTKIMLYAPTFRDDYDFNTYDLDYKKLIKSLEKRFGGKWIIMVRFHYKLRNIKFGDNLSKSIINVTNYYDIQDLICASDAALTDYSSWMCDFVLTDKPGFLYINDFESYNNERGFYYSLDETPFPISLTNEELEKNILSFDEKEYETKREEFLKLRGCFEKGNASIKIVDKIQKINED